MDYLQRMFAHMRWADRHVLDSLIAAAGEPPATALVLFSHIVAAEHVWLSRIQGVAQQVSVWPTLSLHDCARIAQENAEGFESLLREGGPDALSRSATYRNSAGAEFTTPVDDILIHVSLHGCYHRGQIAALLRGSGMVPTPTDYIGFVRGVPAASRGDGANGSGTERPSSPGADV
ncbi:MAG: damage-inducible protein DinB [Gemmatimonadaceae bacterium]|nr:damage-inducible protein DinB [Gemmatimonadaceae bacterium]MDQ3243413.1 damage-inducible protein DinB [Gemmatimonadota bacterium]